jgi:hypothetical protein
MSKITDELNMADKSGAVANKITNLAKGSITESGGAPVVTDDALNARQFTRINGGYGITVTFTAPSNIPTYTISTVSAAPNIVFIASVALMTVEASSTYPIGSKHPRQLIPNGFKFLSFVSDTSLGVYGYDTSVIDSVALMDMQSWVTGATSGPFFYGYKLILASGVTSTPLCFHMYPCFGGSLIESGYSNQYPDTLEPYITSNTDVLEPNNTLLIPLKQPDESAQEVVALAPCIKNSANGKSYYWNIFGYYPNTLTYSV